MLSHLSFDRFLDKRIHLGVTGSIAAYKSLELLRHLRTTGARVGVTLTRAAREFVTPLSFQALGAEKVYTDLFPQGGDVFGHLEPGQHSDVLVIAPATANILGKLACGIADDILSCQALAFPRSIVVAPAMNCRLWEAAATRENWARLLSRGVVGVEPEEGPMACGETGQGRLARLEAIFLETLRALSPQDLAGKRVLVTLGPTREPWDSVRFLSNPSSGTMGAALAVAAWLRGAEVTAVCGPVDLYFPPTLHTVKVRTAREMHQACMDLWPGMDIGALCAAVSDFSPVPFGQGKFKKDQAPAEGLTMQLTPNPDILRGLGERKGEGQRLMGFAAETADLEANARRKLASKNLDLIVGNRVDRPGSGFEVPTNAVFVLDRTGREEYWPEMPKTEVAWRLWDLISEA